MLDLLQRWPLNLRGFLIVLGPSDKFGLAWPVRVDSLSSCSTIVDTHACCADN